MALVAAASGAVPVQIDEGRQPQVAVIRDGVFVAYAKDGAIHCAASKDGGKTFAPSVKVSHPAHMPVGMRRGPRIVATEKALIITAIQRPSGRDGDVIAWRSLDQGKTWSAVVESLNSEVAAAREGLHGMAAGPNGAVFCAWLDLRNAAKGHGTEVWGARSTDDGATWSKDFLIYRSPEKSVCECCHPSVAYTSDGKNVAVMFRNELSGARDMYWVESTDGGRSFGPAQKLGLGTWKLKACPMDGGMIAYPGAELTSGTPTKPSTAWRRGNEVFVATSGAQETKVGDGLQPWVAEAAGVPLVVWVTARPGDLMVARGNAQPRRVAEAAADPSIAAGSARGDPVIAAWEHAGQIIVLPVSAIE